jgi:hypothetical protein
MPSQPATPQSAASSASRPLSQMPSQPAALSAGRPRHPVSISPTRPPMRRSNRHRPPGSATQPADLPTCRLAIQSLPSPGASINRPSSPRIHRQPAVYTTSRPQRAVLQPPLPASLFRPAVLSTIRCAQPVSVNALDRAATQSPRPMRTTSRPPNQMPSPPDAPLNQIPSVRCPQPAALSIRPPSPPVPINRPIQPAEPVHSATHPQPFQPSLSSTTRSDSLSHPITRPPTNGPFPSGPSPTSRSSRRSAVSTFALPTSGPSTSGPPGGCPSIQLALSQLTPTPLPQQCHSVESHLAAPPSTVPPIPVQSVPLLFGFLVMAGFVHRVGSR